MDILGNAAVHTFFIQIRIAGYPAVRSGFFIADRVWQQILVGNKPRLVRIIFFQSFDKGACGTDSHAAQAAFTVKIIQSAVYHGGLSVDSSFAELKYHIGAGGITETAVNTFFL